MKRIRQHPTFAELADAIYNAHFGHLDDKRFHAAKRQEILDWLMDGDPVRETVGKLIAEWGEYDSADVALQARKREAANA